MLFCTQGYNVMAIDSNLFENPDTVYAARPIWNLNGILDKNKIDEQLKQLKLSGMYNGLTVFPTFSTKPELKTDDYMSLYGSILQDAKDNNLKITYYDDQNIPSGYAGGLLSQTFPEALAQRLFKTEYDVEGRCGVNYTIPAGNLMAVVAMNTSTQELINLKNFLEDTSLNWSVPDGKWKVMFFTCKRDNDDNTQRNIVDYLNPASVNSAINLTYDRFNKNFGEYFGNTVDMSLFCDVGFSYVQDSKAWTSSFNDYYESKYNENPDLLYPALWYDIGDNTQSARARLFGVRSEMLSEGYPKLTTEWSNAHGMVQAGSPVSFQSLVPTGICGDQMKFYKNVDIPVINEMNYPGYAKQYYKLVSSAAYDYGKKIVAANMFEGYNALDETTIYKSIMDAYVRGINFLMPNAVWYDSSTSGTKSNFSYDNPDLGSKVVSINEYISRLNSVLQGGSHVSDVGVLYPVNSLNSFYNFTYASQNTSSIVDRDKVPYADYLDVGEWLFTDIKCDYTFLQPDVLTQNCTVNGDKLIMDNGENSEEYKVLIMPGSELISVDDLAKIKEFYDNGGKVIATSELPFLSLEEGKNSEIVSMIKDIFNVDPKNVDITVGKKSSNKNSKGGMAVFINTYGYGDVQYVNNSSLLETVINDMLPVKDVSIEDNDIPVIGGSINYLHKILDNKDVYFLTNTSITDSDNWILFRGKFKPQCWDPHTGEIYAPQYINTKINEQSATKVKVSLKAAHSLFVINVGKSNPKDGVLPLLFAESFDNKGNWLSSGRAKILPNSLELQDTKSMLTVQGKDWKNYTASITFAFSEDSKAGFIFRAENDENYYLWKFDGKDAVLCKVTDGNESVIKTVSCSLLPNISYRLKVVLSGEEITTYLGDNMLDRSQDSAFKTGKIGLYSEGTSNYNSIVVLSEISYQKPVFTPQQITAICLIVIVLLEIKNFTIVIQQFPRRYLPNNS
jgi:hypothetical protein